MSNISIIIPCYYKHFIYIGNLLNEYERQTLKADEIIVVLSEYKKVNMNYIEIIENRYKNVKIIKVEERSPAGANRYIGASNATNDIIIFQDADDFPHFQRNEMIAKCFYKHPDIVHVLHGFSRFPISMRFNNLPIKKLYHNMFFNHQEMALYNLTNGNIAIRKDIVDKIKWELQKFRGQDVQLNKNIYSVYKKYAIICLPLYVYRQQLSSRNNK